MQGISERLGVETYCYRNFKDNKDVITQIKAAELSHVELCGMHADMSNPATFASVAKLYTESGITVDAIFPPAMFNKPSEEAFYACAKLTKSRVMCVHHPVVDVSSFKVAEELAEKHDVYVAIHNHGGQHWLGSSEMLDFVFKRTGPRVGLCLDTAWAMTAQEDPVKMIERFAGRLLGVHLKDFVFDAKAHPSDIVAGNGALDLKGVIGALRKVDFKGFAMLEYEGEPDNPTPAIRESAMKVRKAFSS